MIWRNPEPKCVSLQTSENLSNEIKMWETESHDNYLLKVCLQAHLWLYNGLQEAKCFYQTENYIKRHWLRVRIIHSSDSTHCGHLWWQWLKRVNQISWISSHGVDVMTRSPDSRLANKMSFFVVFFLSKVARRDSWSTNGRFCAVEKESIFRNTQVSSIFSAGLGHNWATLWKMTEYKRTWNRGWTEKETSPSQ